MVMWVPIRKLGYRFRLVENWRGNSGRVEMDGTAECGTPRTY